LHSDFQLCERQHSQLTEASTKTQRPVPTLAAQSVSGSPKAIPASHHAVVRANDVFAVLASVAAVST